MSWQSPAFSPSRSKLWKGGFTRIFGCVSDGITDTFGLRQWCDAYLVLYDSVVMDPAHYTMTYPRLVLNTVPPEGTWIEVIGIGVVDDIVVDHARWTRGSWDDIRSLADHISMGTSNRFVWDHVPNEGVETASGALYHAGTDRVYSMPQDASAVYAVDAVTMGYEEHPTPNLDLYDHNKFAGGFMRANGRIYGVPDAAGYVPEFDPTTGESRMLPIADFESEPVWTDRMFQCGAVFGDVAVGIPFDAKYFLVVDLGTGAVRQADLGLDPAELAVPGKWDGVGYDSSGNAYAVPYNSRHILKITPGLAAALIEVEVGAPERASKYRGGCVVDDVLYCAPFNADHIMAYDTADNNFLDVPVPDIGAARFKFWGCAATGGGVVVFAPHDARRIMLYDIASGVASFAALDGQVVDAVDRDFAYAGAWGDPFGKVHLSPYQAPCDVVVDADLTVRLWRQDSRKDFHRYGAGDRPFQLGGACDRNGVALFLPWRDNATTPWSVDATGYAIDAVATGLPIVNPLCGESAKGHWYFGDEKYREIAGVLDMGDLRYQMQDDGDIWRDRVSGMELYARFDYDVDPDEPLGRESVFSDVAWPLDTDWHYPRSVWARNKAFYGLETTNGGSELVSLPNSQPYYVFRPNEFARAATPFARLTGNSRDQWYNGSYMAADGRIWSIPYNSPHIMYFDVATEMAHLDTFGLDMRDRKKWYGGVRAGQYLFGVPFNRDKVLVVDCGAGTVYETDFGLDLSAGYKFMSGVYRDGKVVMVPANHDKFLVIDVSAMTAELTDFGLPAATMAQELKWGSCGINQSNQIVCGPLGTGWGTRKPAVINDDGTAFVCTSSYGGFSAVMYIQGHLIFRPKVDFGDSQGRPYRVPAVMTPSTAFTAYRTALLRAYPHETIYVIDHYVYGMSDGRDFVYSVATEDWSTYNERYTEVPGLRPWIGLAPAALVHYDADEFARYGTGVRAYRKEALWNDPIYVGNNTAYAVNCNGGIICRCTVESYNHFREYLRETNNHEDSYRGAIQHDGKIWPVPSSIPLMDVIDQDTKRIERVYVEPPPGWRGFDMHRGGTEFGGKLVFYPGETPYFSYYDPAAGVWEHYKIPDLEWMTNGWREWIRVDDEVWGIPYNAETFVIWDLAAKTTTHWAPTDTHNWGNKLWSDGLHWRKDASHADRELSFLLPYNGEKLAVMYAWAKDMAPEVDHDYYDAVFPGLKKWSCWASPTDRRPVMFGVPANAQGVLRVDVRGGEPTVSDYGITLSEGWEQDEKWNSCVSHVINGREFAVFVPYNARDILLVDWNTNRVYKANYTGTPLTGTRKWWGGWSHGDRVFCVPYDAQGLLEIRFTIVPGVNDISIDAVGSLATYGISMTGLAKWRGCVFMQLYQYSANNGNIWVAVCIPANANRFVAFYFNKGGAYSTYPAGGPNSNPYEAYITQMGVLASQLEGTDKWAPLPSVSKPAVDIVNAYPEETEYAFPAWNHDHTIRLVTNAYLPQAFAVPHRQPANRRGWVGTRFQGSWPKGSGTDRSWSLPWTCGSFLMHRGSEVDEFEAGFVMDRMMKFGPAALDKRRKLVCAPFGGTAPLMVDVDTRESRWLHRTTNGTGAVSGCDYIHASNTGRVYLYPGRDYVFGRNPLPHQGDIYLDSRPIIRAGEGYVIDTMVAMRDSFSFWPRWPTFAYEAADSRFSCPDVPQSCCPQSSIQVPMPVDYYSAIASGPDGFVFLPAVSGMLVSHRVRRGRPHSRRQLQWSGVRGLDRVQRPAPTMVPAFHAGTLFLFNTRVKPEIALEPYLDDVLYIAVKDGRSSFVPHGESFGAGVSECVVVQRGGFAYWLPTNAVDPVSEALIDAENTIRLDLETGEEIRDRRVTPSDWHQRVFGKYVFSVGAVVNRVTLDGAPEEDAGWMTVALFTHESLRKAGWDGDAGVIYVVGHTLTRKEYVEDGWLLGVTVTAVDADTGARSAHTFAFDLVGAASTTVVLGAAAYHDGFLYVPVGRAPHIDAVMAANEFHYLKLDVANDEGWLMSAPGADSADYWQAVVAGDAVWFIHHTNPEYLTFTRFDPVAGEARRPFDNGTAVQRPGGHASPLAPFNLVHAVGAGGEFYFVPAVIVSRAALVYVMDPAAETLVIRSYHEPKVPRKWNGAIQMGDMVYGVPFCHNRVLVMDFADADNVVVRQAEVTRFLGNAVWDRAMIEYGVGNVLVGMLHRSDPAENVGRGGVVTRYGHAMAAPYAGRKGQTLEILRDGEMRMRVPGPFFDANRKWGCAVLGDDGRIYAAPFDAAEVLTIDPVLEAAGTSSANLTDELAGDAKWMVAAHKAGSGVAYMLPFDREDILAVDYAGKLLSFVEPVDSGGEPVDLSGQAKWMSGFMEGDEHFLVPYGHDKVGVFNLETKAFDFLDVPESAADRPGDRRWRGAVKAYDDRYYCGPFDASDILCIDPRGRTVERISPKLRIAGADKWLHAVADGQDAVYMYGGSSSSVLELTFNGGVRGRYIDPDSARAPAADQYLAARAATLGDDPHDQLDVVDLIPRSGKLQQAAGDHITGFGVTVSPNDVVAAVPVDNDFTYYIPKSGAVVSYTDTREAEAFKTFKAKTRIPHADKYGEPAVVNGVSYFPPKGSGGWLIVEKDGWFIDLASAVDDIEGVVISEHCNFAVQFGPDKVLAPATDGNYFLVLSLKTRKTLKTSFGLGGSYWEGMDRTVKPGVAGDGTVYVSHDEGLVSIKPSGAVTRVNYDIKVVAGSDMYVAVAPHYWGGAVSATWATVYGAPQVYRMDLKTGIVSMSNDAYVPALSVQADGAGIWFGPYMVAAYTALSNPSGLLRDASTLVDGHTVDTMRPASAADLVTGGVLGAVNCVVAGNGVIGVSSRLMFKLPAGQTEIRQVTSSTFLFADGYARKNGDVVFAPFDSAYWGIVGGGTWTNYAAPADYSASLEGVREIEAGTSQFSRVVDAGDKAYCLPYNARYAVIVRKGDDGVPDSLEYTDFGLDLSGDAKFVKAFSVGKYVVAIPSLELTVGIMVIDTEFDEAGWVSDTTGMLVGGYATLTQADGAVYGVFRDRCEAHEITLTPNSWWVDGDPGAVDDAPEADSPWTPGAPVPAVPPVDDNPWGLFADLRGELATLHMPDVARPRERPPKKRMMFSLGVSYKTIRGRIGTGSELVAMAPTLTDGRMYLPSSCRSLYPVVFAVDPDAGIIRCLGFADNNQRPFIRWMVDVSTESLPRWIVSLISRNASWATYGQYMQHHECFVTDLDAAPSAGYPPGWLAVATSRTDVDPGEALITAPSNLGFLPDRLGFCPLFSLQQDAWQLRVDNRGIYTVNLGGTSNFSAKGIHFKFGHEDAAVLTPDGVLYYTAADRAGNLYTRYMLEVVEPELKSGAGVTTAAWMAPATIGGTTYVFPYDAISALELSGPDGYINLLPAVPTSQRKYMGCVAVSDTEILLLPWSADTAFAVYNTAERSFRIEDFGIEDEEFFQGAEKFKRAFMRSDGRCVVLPHRRNHMIVIDVDAWTAEVVDLPVANIVDGTLMWGDWFERGGKYYGVPYNADYVVRLDVDDMTMEKVEISLVLSGRCKWGAGCATTLGDVIFLPYRDELSLYFAVDTREAYRTGFGTRADMMHLSPVGKVVRWWNNAELLPENSERPGAGEGVDSPGSGVEYDWFALSADNGAARYDRDAGNVLGTPKQWAAHQQLPVEQYSDFIYAPATGRVFGIPHNARDILVVSRGLSDISVAQSRMSPDLTVNYHAFRHENKDCDITYRLHGDNFMTSAYTHEYEPMLIAGGSGINLIVDSFTGIMTIDRIYDAMEWNRPVYVDPMPGSTPEHLSLWQNIMAVFSTAALGLDGCVYMFTSSAEWGLVGRGISGANDKLFHPVKIVRFETIFHTRPEYPESRIPIAAASVTPSGRIVTFPGEPVTVGKLINSFGTKAWFDAAATGPRWRDLDDARGMTISRARYWLSVLDTGYHADSKASVVTSPLLNNR
jgi:hypothetical protein